jgi:hypothetical protein
MEAKNVGKRSGQSNLPISTYTVANCAAVRGVRVKTDCAVVTGVRVKTNKKREKREGG